MEAVPKDSDLLGLYQEIILDHGKSPRNAGVIENADCRSDGKNPLCGDRVAVTTELDQRQFITDIKFDGKGCAISIASASMMTEAVKGLSVADARLIFEAVRTICSKEASVLDAMQDVGDELAPRLEKLASLSGVRQFPARVKCATLPWHTLVSCLDGKTTASTER
ncbi:MAG: SUF system NifU family Fe-S cluster assembly protein [Rhodospirillaceae bacterium]